MEIAKRSPTALRSAVLAAIAAAPLLALAQPITLLPDTLNMFRDTRGANDVGIGQGDLFQFGANISGGPGGVTLGAVYPATGFTVSQVACVPLTTSPNFCARTTPFNSGRLGDWTMHFQRGSNELLVAAPSLAGTAQPVPFPISVTLSGSTLTPTLSWTIPTGFSPDGLRLQLFDKGRILANGQADIVHSVAVAPASTSYTLPTVFSSGLPLLEGESYAINLQLIETRGHQAFTNNNAQILRRSSSFFDFTPLASGGPPLVYLPTIVSGVYNFSIGSVGPSSVTFIDPDVAVGYDYAVGAGNPNFASVLLPDVGDGQFTLEYTDASGAKNVSLSQGTQYFFGEGGVAAFRVIGIETSAMLDPHNGTAFVTGLTFAANGAFTGTMTPLTVFVPVPEAATWAQFGAGLLLLLTTLARRRLGWGALRRGGDHAMN